MTSINQYGLPSPLNSALSPTPSQNSSLATQATLPTQRHHPLGPGSPKEIALINYVDDKVLYITRRYATKFTDIKTRAEEASGYTRFEKFIQDLNPLIDLVWATGTPSLQIPYMLTFAGMVASYMPAFPFTNDMFPLLKRLDIAFSTLLQTRETSHPGSRQVVSTTEKVRIKSLVDETRVTAVRHGTSAGHTIDIAEASQSDNDDDDDDDVVVEETLTNLGNSSGIPADSRHVAMALSRIYESTMVILGDSLAAPTIPVQTDDSMDTN